MKRFVSVLLAVVLMLSLSVCVYADTLMYGAEPQVLPENFVRPYALYPVNSDPDFISSYFNYASMVQDGDLVVGSGLSLWDFSPSGGIMNVFGIGHSTGVPMQSPTYWFNCVGKFIDANGYVLKASDFDMYFLYSVNPSKMGWLCGQLDPASDNTYQFDDGYIQFCMRTNGTLDTTNLYTGYLVLPRVSNSNVVGPLSFELETFDFYTGEPDNDYKPFPFGPDAHSTTPAGPKDPNDASQYGSASDQVEWFNDAFGGAVDPELDNKIVAGNDMLLQQEEIEQDVIADFQQYSSQVDPANITFPTAVLNGMSFIGTTFMSSYNNLGDISFVISLSMMIGVVLVLIGRGEGALARGISASSRERRRTEYASDRDMKKGG